MKLKSYISAFLLGTAMLCTTSCMEEFAELNTNPSTIGNGNVPYLFTQALLDFEPQGYTYWFYNARYTGQWAQAFVPTGGYTSTINQMGATGEQGSQNQAVLKYAREIDMLISKMEPADGAKYTYLRAMLDPLIVYLGIFDTDMYGDMPFTEACMAKYSDPMLLTPKYDTVEELYTLWIEMLDNAIATLTNDVVVDGATIPQTIPSAQDIIYAGDTAKWAKLANSLKLKIAVRLLHQNKTRALAIASEVASSPAGVLSSANDNFVYNKGDATNGGDKTYHWGNSVSSGAASQYVIDFMVRNKDPRVRFFFNKNRYNSIIVQSFFDNDKDLPSYIAENVEYTEVNGKKQFVAWKGDGEPWVRYYGLPTEVGAATMATKYGDYFEGSRWQLTIGDAVKSYTPYSVYNEEMIRGRIDFTVPTVPGGPIIRDIVDVPWYGMYFSAAEVNLYMAELKLLGASLPQDAATYYTNAVRSSVEEYDRIAGLNDIPYYSQTYDYDPNEATISLKSGELDAMMAHSEYQLTGTQAEQLEKVYLQEFLHFMFYPSDQYSVVRRSGIPKRNSTLIPWTDVVESTDLPRRFEVGTPSPTDLMGTIKNEAYQRQGFTTGNGISPSLLNSERVWQDIGAPNFGEGPNF